MSNDIQKALNILPPKTIRNILDELSKIQRKGNNETLEGPMVTLHLKSGRDLTGWFLNMGDIKLEISLLFQLRGSDGRPSYDVVYLNPERIEAITVHNIHSIAHLISDGAVPFRPGISPPSKLELKRKSQYFTEVLKEEFGFHTIYEIDWENIPQSGDSLWNLEELISSTTDIFFELLQDEFSTDIIKKSIKKVIFSNFEEPSVIFKEGILSIMSNLSKGREGRLSGNALRNAIEKVL